MFGALGEYAEATEVSRKYRQVASSVSAVYLFLARAPPFLKAQEGGKENGRGDEGAGQAGEG